MWLQIPHPTLQSATSAGCREEHSTQTSRQEFLQIEQALQQPCVRERKEHNMKRCSSCSSFDQKHVHRHHH